MHILGCENTEEPKVPFQSTLAVTFSSNFQALDRHGGWVVRRQFLALEKTGVLEQGRGMPWGQTRS